jgi:hypothetical protein
MADDWPPILALVSDLMFGSKIAAEARAAGTTAKILRKPEQLADEEGGRLLVDLNVPGAIPAAVEWRARTGGDVIGYVSHVDAATTTAARAAGLTTVMARSRFVERLSTLLGTDAPDHD